MWHTCQCYFGDTDAQSGTCVSHLSAEGSELHDRLADIGAVVPEDCDELREEDCDKLKDDYFDLLFRSDSEESVGGFDSE